MKATCPNSPEHKEFYTCASVLEEWRVDENVESLELTAFLAVVHVPYPGNTWTCTTCN